jgi:hypothetical protein
MSKRKRKRTSAEKAARHHRKQKFVTIFVNGRRKRIPRPPIIDGMPVDEFIARNAGPIWLHEHGLWELMISEKETEWRTELPTSPLESTNDFLKH